MVSVSVIADLQGRASIYSLPLVAKPAAAQLTLFHRFPRTGPANIAFDGAGRILLTNHAPVTGLVLRRFSIVDADVVDPGAPLFTP